MYNFFRPNACRPTVRIGQAAIAGAFVAISGLTAAAAGEVKPPSQIVQMLKAGGYVIYMRHASTEKDYADQVSAEVGNCATQRTLSEKGWNEAEMIGASFSVLDIPVGALYSSEYCRAWKTARIAFGKPVKQAALNFEPAETYSPDQLAKMRSAVVPMLSALPSSGTNTVIVGHDDPFEAATGIYPEPQGVSYVVKPLGDGKFEVIGSIKPADWPALLNSGS